MSNLSKSGINATAEMFGTAETLKKAVAPDCNPSGRCLLETLLRSLIMSACLASEGGDRDPSRPAVAQRSVEMSSGLCLPVSEQECSFNHL